MTALSITAASIFALSLLMKGLLALARPQAIIAFNAWIARRLKRRPSPERETHVRTAGMIETIIGALLLAVIRY